MQYKQSLTQHKQLCTPYINIKKVIQDQENDKNSRYAIISGYASVFNVLDSYGEVILKGAFQKNLHKKNITLLWNHNAAQPIGLVTKMEEDDYGLLITAEINKSTKKGIEVLSLIEQGAVKGLSIGFIIKDSSDDKSNQNIKQIKEVELLEISIVTLPANKEAQIHHYQKSYIKQHSDHKISVKSREIESAKSSLCLSLKKARAALSELT